MMAWTQHRPGRGSALGSADQAVVHASAGRAEATRPYDACGVTVTTVSTERALRGLTWEHDRGYGSMAAAAERYEAITGVAVRFEARSLQAFADAPLDRITADYDLVVIDHPHIPIAARDGLLIALDETGHGTELDDLARHSVGRSHASYAQADRRVLEPAHPRRRAGTPPPTSPLPGPGVFLDETTAHRTLQLLHRLTALTPARCLTLNPIEVADQLSTGDQYAYAPLLFGYTNYSRAPSRHAGSPTPSSAPIASVLSAAAGGGPAPRTSGRDNLGTLRLVQAL